MSVIIETSSFSSQKQRALWGALLFCVQIAFAEAPPAAMVPPVVTILCYHTFDSKKETPYTVTGRQFDEQLRFLRAQNITVIPLADLVAHLQTGAPLPAQSAVITIDDGYRSAKTKAWPVLKRYNAPFTLFVYPGAVGRHGNALKWKDIKEMAAAGVDIESHSLTHPLLTHPGKEMTHAEFVSWLDVELQESKKRLEDAIGKPVTALAYPFGGYDETVAERAKAAGYGSAYTCDEGEVSAGTDLLHLNRCLVYRTTTPKQFAAYLNTFPIHVTTLFPRDGERLSARDVSVLRGRVENVADILPETATLYIDKSGMNRRAVTVDPVSGDFRFNLPHTLSGGYHFVNFSARDRLVPTRSRETTWLFIVRGNASKKQPKSKVD